ncbi:MAG TPA: VOC family protein [Allosphingosinicella sp.]|jgi:catechol 2,3-dioxygenase-like lactoylglutathione lyase family enzyme|nr:VOC family protein [Allosphingosinicella sp.]
MAPRFALLALTLATMPAAGPAAPAGPLSDARLLQITLPAKDLSRSVAFYQGILGLKLLFTVPNAAFLEAGGVRLRLEQSQTLAPTGAVELYFDDPGLARAEPLKARGVKFVGPPETVQHLKATDLQLLEFVDPDGNALALMGEVPRPAG